MRIIIQKTSRIICPQSKRPQSKLSMSFGKYLHPDAVALNSDCSNRKKALHTLASLVSSEAADLNTDTVFKHLLQREKLGSTGLGNGIAIPHCRLAGIETPRAAMLRLQKGIDFDAPDETPVYLFCALVVSDEDNEKHLKTFSALIHILKDKASINRLLTTSDTQEAIDTLCQEGLS